MNRRRAGLWGVALVCVAAAGCGAPTEGTRVIDGEAVPYGLLSPSPAPMVTTEPTPERDEMTAQVFFVGPDDLLVPSVISVNAGPADDLVPEILTALEAGPDEEARADGLGTALGPDIQLRLTKIVGTTAYVDLLVATREPEADQIPLAVGQIVLSVTSLAGISQMVLLVEGEEVDVPLPGGQRTSGPVTAASYEDLLATAPPP